MLSAAGVQLVPFSPLHDSKLPPGLSAVLLGGGAVAECGQQLAGNRPMLEALRAFAAAGGLVMGEGAALMYLSRSLQRPGQLQHSMGECGVLAAAVNGFIRSRALLACFGGQAA
jgi:cobyrinic acid a,c-diamide synthase